MPTIVGNRPWLIQSTLDYLCTDIDCEPTLNTGGAIGMRLLAAILDALEAHGLERIAPKEESRAQAGGKTIREEQGRYRVTRDPGISSIPRAYLSLN